MLRRNIFSIQSYFSPAIIAAEGGDWEIVGLHWVGDVMQVMIAEETILAQQPIIEMF